ncbi:Hypothetical predicted protein [Marmota monax]|uniref:Uncharacterized protein n=1 Tax=Marmota monax TaxID=9995 RepID=A0A5E4D462_MARMO|nr:Hypothetical predicted protein [Marmota monax]
MLGECSAAKPPLQPITGVFKDKSVGRRGLCSFILPPTDAHSTAGPSAGPEGGAPHCGVLQNDAEPEPQMRAEIQDMKQEFSMVNKMDEFARYARLEWKINKMVDQLKTYVKARTAQLAKIK